MAQQLTVPLPLPSDLAPEDGVLRYLGCDGCVRLPVRVDVTRLISEFDRLPAEAWGRTERGPVVFAAVESLFVVGYPRNAANPSSEDRSVLAQLPYLREILHQVMPGPPKRAFVSRQLSQGLLPIHTDDRRFFRRTVRLSIQVDADGPQRLFCNGLWYNLAPGEIWALDNLVPHGVMNAGHHRRMSVVADYLPSNELAALIAAGDHGLGVSDDSARLALESSSKEHYRKHRWKSIQYGFVKLWRRRGAR